VVRLAGRLETAPIGLNFIGGERAIMTMMMIITTTTTIIIIILK